MILADRVILPLPVNNLKMQALSALTPIRLTQPNPRIVTHTCANAPVTLILMTLRLNVLIFLNV